MNVLTIGLLTNLGRAIPLTPSYEDNQVVWYHFDKDIEELIAVLDLEAKTATINCVGFHYEFGLQSQNYYTALGVLTSYGFDVSEC